MSRARDFADFISTGQTPTGILADGAIATTEITGVTVSNTEINRLAGVTSDVQTQINSKAPSDTPTLTGDVVVSTGNFMVGKTTSTIGVAGTSIESTGRVEINADSITPLTVSRITDEGDMIRFYEGSTQRGTIGIELNDLFITSANSGLRFDYNNTRVIPCTTTGAASDNTDDFGDPASRWKDGYFAGTMTAGSFSGDGSALTGIQGFSYASTLAFGDY